MRPADTNVYCMSCIDRPRAKALRQGERDANVFFLFTNLSPGPEERFMPIVGRCIALILLSVQRAEADTAIAGRC